MPAPKTQIEDFAPIQDWANHPLWKAAKYRWYWFLISPSL